ncbi:hypothetical protein GO986_18910 [Deinococcus sp. HMF7620]|uniref:Uncharacterized protein n=1 Tax=Deinococcus arboris TaxID=2682977 RepID=A0A7C9HTS1_9DEIO|nr:hypothetical protein [Deinococcus arboris]MVN88814.1 hypothetical protein [Deinococcus arboris]
MLESIVRGQLPALFGLVGRFPGLEAEAAVTGAVHEMLAVPEAFGRSGLPGPVWVLGMAQRHFQRLSAAQ